MQTGDREESVSTPNDVKQETRWLHLRASMRLNSRVPMAVEWNEGGRTLRAEGHTVDVSVRGCLAVIPQGFPLGQKFRVENLVNKKRAEAVLIWKGHEGRSGWELGIELINAPHDFWELDF
jgi:hypothetical protein